MTITDIKVEDWEVNINCPNCHRDRKVKPIFQKRGVTIQGVIFFPSFCIWCEQEKEQVNKNG